ncbi:MAG: pantoate--beta-alanine ligase [Candidatus Omnitrophota bacterium]
MVTIKKNKELQAKIKRLRSQGKTIGFVPTMGALHEGHLSLVRRARKDNDIVVVSIFVNPLQFGSQEDLQHYPRPLQKDRNRLKGLCDILFLPSAKEMYPSGFCSKVEVRALGDVLCGLRRKGHFAGVTTVVAKLFHAAMPDKAYFGQKDAQQAVVIRKMTEDLNMPIQICVLPIVRENDGLAMSSRNAYLSGLQRRDAVVLYQALKSAQRMVAGGTRDSAKIKAALVDFIKRAASAHIEYIEIVDENSLRPIGRIAKRALLLLAVHIGKIRLVDNMMLRAN